MCLDLTLNTHLHCANSWVESHQPGCNSGCDRNENYFLRAHPIRSPSANDLSMLRFEIGRLVDVYKR